MSTRFRTVSEAGDTVTAQAEVEPGHTVTRRHVWADRFGPVPGSHFVEYLCTCGAYTRGQDAQGPRSSDLDGLHHFASVEEREAYQARQREVEARIQRVIARGTRRSGEATR